MTEDQNECIISEWIAHAIADCGVTVVYGGHGGALVPLVNAVAAHPQLKWVCARNEHDASTMAASHAKFTGGLGVVIATSGPGATNLLTGLMEAAMDHVPLLAITGMKPTAQLGYSEFQDVNQSRIFASSGIEWSKDAASPSGVIPLLRDAVSTALKYRTCSHLAIPVDIQAAPSSLRLKHHFCAPLSFSKLHVQRTVDPSLLDKCAHALVGAVDERNPRIIIAVGRRACYNEYRDKEWNISETILEFAEALNAPILTRLDAKGVVDEDHPLAFGVVGVHGKPGLEVAATLISTSDVVVSIGVDDETLLVCNVAGLQIRKIIEIEPDSVCLSTRFHSEQSLVGDVRDICRDLTGRVETLSAKKNKKIAIARAKSGEFNAEMMKRVDSERFLDLFGYMAHNSPNTTIVEKHGRRRRSLKSLEGDSLGKILQDADFLWERVQNGDWQQLFGVTRAMHYKNLKSYTDSPSSSEFCHPAAVLNAISAARRDDSISSVARRATVAVDVGDITLWASLCLHLGAGSRTLYSERLGTMGYALCAGIAAVLASADPAGAIVLAGDGGFQMTMQELATFQQHKKAGDKLLCIVFDNGLLGRVAFGFDNALGCELSGWDYVGLAKSCGGDGIRLDRSENADSVIRQALEADGLFLIHVIVDPACKADMAAFKNDNSLKIVDSG